MAIRYLLSGFAVFFMLCFPVSYAASMPAAEPDDSAVIRACDTYGVGYFYIPGTETCLRFSGYVRSDIKGGDNVSARKYGSLHRNTYSWQGRGTIRIHTASQTDWGPLRSFTELTSDWKAGAENSTANDSSGGTLRLAYIELGGLRVGLDDTIFAYWTGYYGNVMSDDVLTPSEKRTNSISYTLNTEEGFSAILGLEQGDDYNHNGNGTIPDKNNAANSRYGGFRFKKDGSKRYKALNAQTQNWAPYIVGGLKYTHDWGGMSVVLGYDSYDSEWAAKARLEVDITERFSVFLMGGYKSMDDYYNLDTSYGAGGIRSVTKNGAAKQRYGLYRQINSAYGDWGGHSIAWLGGTYKFNPRTSFNFQNAYSEDKSFASSLNITKQVLSGLTLVGEMAYRSWNDSYSQKQANGDEYRNALKGQNAVQGTVRLQRAF